MLKWILRRNDKKMTTISIKFHLDVRDLVGVLAANPFYDTPDGELPDYGEPVRYVEKPSKARVEELLRSRLYFAGAENWYYWSDEVPNGEYQARMDWAKRVVRTLYPELALDLEKYVS